MYRYRVTNRKTDQTMEIRADSAQEACQKLGWMIGWCYVKKLTTPCAQ